MFQFVGLLKPNGNMLLANSASLTGAGITAQDIKNVPFENTPWWSDSQRETIREHIQSASKGQFVRFETQLFGGNDGKDLIWVDFSLSPVMENEKIIYILFEARDITAKRDAEQQIQEKNDELKRLCSQIVAMDEMKTRFFANVSHELRTPLTLILSPIEKMLQQPKLSPLFTSSLQVVRRNSQTLLKHINDLLDVSRLEANEMKVNFSQVDLSQLCRLICSNFDCLIKERRIQFLFEENGTSTTSSNSILTWINWLDREKIERVLFNLLSNAFKFTPSGGRVSVALSWEHKTNSKGNLAPFAAIRVSDSGVGIKKEDRGFIFDRFARVEGSNWRSFGGSGLGLAICKDFVELHGGKISVTDSKWGGAEFCVYLPIVIDKPENHNMIEDVILMDQEKGASLADQVLSELSHFPESKEEQEKKDREGQEAMRVCESAISTPSASPSPPYIPLSPLSKTTSIVNSANFKLNSSGTTRPTIITNSASKGTRSPTSSPKATDSPPNPFSPPTSTSSPQLDKKRLKALVVEDNQDMRAFVKEVLMEDFEVLEAGDGMEGLVKAMREIPDLIVSDVMMPKLSGEEMMVKIRTQRSLDDTPIVFLTAKAEDSVRISALQNGAQEYLNKPFAADELRIRCANLISNYGARRLLQEHLKSQKANLVELTNEILESKRNVQKSLQLEERAHAEAERYSRIKDEFLMTVGHELRTPLTGIMGWTELIQAELSSGENIDATELSNDFQNILNCCQAQRRIIDDLLDISSIVSGKLELNSIHLEVTDVLKDALASVKLSAIGRQIDLQGNWEELLGSDKSFVLGDRARVQQVVWNLLSNAIKFTEPGGSVTLSASYSQFSIDNSQENHNRKVIKVSVTDTGRGLSQEDFARLFKRFGQLDSSSTREYNGLGLGLAICKHIVEGHGGYLWAESKGLGKGSTFSFLLPWIPAPHV
eukprot:TRINITY_DN2019_c2_g1_i1.p1 TRINITY_DN2019_c2_g1~~TRINITY_DN2019_c2_g1_i1.p1  ORF type:complete len:940 (-),score=326.37 TRINITY_DN2019_c2_g1_i1:137-2956(-)